MDARLTEAMQLHDGHALEVSSYGSRTPANVALECVECFEVLMDFDIEDGRTLQSAVDECCAAYDYLTRTQ
jgi:hypothetical protein